jgi:hypothetical protein
LALDQASRYHGTSNARQADEGGQVMMDTLVSMYEKGAITAAHLVVQSLHMIDPQDPGPVLSHLPPEVLMKMLRYAQEYQPGRMQTNYGRPPAIDQVEAAKGWIEANACQQS